MRVLLTGGGGVGSLALYNQWFCIEPRHEVHLCDSNATARPCWVAREHWHEAPPALVNGLTNPEYIAAMKALAWRMDLVIPGIDEELRPLAARMPEKLLLPDFDTVATHLDKLASMRFLKTHGIDVPATARLRPRLDDRSAYWPPFPCVVKPREGRGSRHVAIVGSESEGLAHVTLSREPAGDFITQEVLVGREYTVGVLADKQKQLKAVIPVRVDQKRGITTRAQVDDDPAVHALGEQIHAAAPFAGYINVQCIKEADGRVRPFEINPRISTTTCLAVAAGLDLIGGYLGGEALPHGLKPLTLRRSYQTEFL